MTENRSVEQSKDFEREPVPQNERKGWVKLAAVWTGIGITLGSVVIGGSLGGGLDFNMAIIAALLGAFVIAVLTAFCAAVGARTGLSTGFVSRFALGEYGSYLVSIVLGISLFGWFGVQTQLFGESANQIVQNVFGFGLDTRVLAIIGGILMTSTAFIGYKAIEKLSLLAVPFMLILLIASLWKVMQGENFSAIVNAAPGGEPLTLGAAVSIVVGSFVTGIVISPDIARYAKSTKDAVIGGFVGYVIGFGSVLSIGAILAKATGQSDIVEIMIGLGWGTFAMLILILAQWTSNDNNLYSAALGFSVIFRKVPKSTLTIAAGLIGTLFAAFNIYDQFIPFLNFLSALIPPIGGVYVADYFLNKSKYSFANIDNITKVNKVGLGAWATGAAIGFLTTAPPIGFGLFSITSAPALDSFIAGAIAQVVLSKLFAVRYAEQPTYKRA